MAKAFAGSPVDVANRLELASIMRKRTLFNVLAGLIGGPVRAWLAVTRG